MAVSRHSLCLVGGFSGVSRLSLCLLGCPCRFSICPRVLNGHLAIPLRCLLLEPPCRSRAEAVPHFLWPSGTRRNLLLHHAIGGCRGTLIAYALRKNEREHVMERDQLL